MKQKASLTVEAVIAFVCYLSFMFMLLLMVKMSMVSIVLNGAVNETAKQIAAVSYPLNILIADADEHGKQVKAFNEAEKKVSEFINTPKEDLVGKVLEEMGGNSSVQSGLEAIKSGNWQAIPNIIKATGEQALGDGKNILVGGIYAGGEYLITTYCADMAAKSIQEYVNDSNMPISTDDIKIRIVKVPMPEQSYENLDVSGGAYADFKLTKDDFDKNDVVIAIEYEYEMNLPFLNQIKLTLRDIAVEQAWMNGCSSMRTWSEGIDIGEIYKYLTGDQPKYWGTDGGECYHKKGCSTLWRGSARVLNGKEGKRACKVCKPGE